MQEDLTQQPTYVYTCLLATCLETVYSSKMMANFCKLYSLTSEAHYSSETKI